MRKIFAMSAAALMATCGTISAMPVNRAISFTPEGTVNCGAMPALNNLDSYSIQFWVNPDAWIDGATIMKRGDNFSVKLGPVGNIIILNGANSVTASADDLKSGEWNQLTLICKNGEATVLVNGEAAGKGTLGSLDETKRAFILGGDYEGLLDEVRLWDAALNEEMETFEYFIFNTLNKWNPMWENLVAYYKMDQENCPTLVEYKSLEVTDGEYDNHGVMSDGVVRVNANNPKLPYLLNAAYTENARFNDRLIPQDAYLLSNEIIILGSDCVAEDGSITLRMANNHGTIHGGVKYVESKGVRSGVVELDGKEGTYIEAPAASLHYYKEVTTDADYKNPKLDSYTFETRLFIDEWQPGAYLFRKENAEQTIGIAIMLGEEEGKLMARVNGQTDVCSDVLVNANNSENKFETGKWNHIAVVSNSGGNKGYKIGFYANGSALTYAKSAGNVTDLSLTEAADLPIYIGENLKGWLDDTYFSNNAFAVGMLQSHTNNGVPVPGVNRYRNNNEYNSTGYLYLFDNPEQLGYSSISQDAIRDQILAQYEGYTQPHIVMSVRGHGTADFGANVADNFNTIMNTPAKRENFAKQLAVIAEGYDGVELDLEWVYGLEGWTNFNNLSKEIIAQLPAGKSFRISTHNVTYEYPKGADGIENPGITGFTFQQYGPQNEHFSFNKFKEYTDKFINYGYPKEKIITSYSTTTANNTTTKSNSGIGRNNSTTNQWAQGALDYYTPGDQDYDEYNGYRYMGPMQVYNRAKYTREKELGGIFYWDMGNDDWYGTIANDGTKTYEGMPKYNMAKYCSFGINSNIDRVVNDVALNYPETEEEPTLSVNPEPEDPEEGDTTGVNGIGSNINVEYYNLQGVKVANPQNGIFIRKQGSNTSKVVIR